MITLHHWTTWEAAQSIRTNGFRDGSGRYMTTKQHTGVWFTDDDEDAMQGMCGATHLSISTKLSEKDIEEYEWIEDGKGYREWLIPAQVINPSIGALCIEDALVHPSWGDDSLRRFAGR